MTLAGSRLLSYLMFVTFGLIIPWFLFVKNQGEFSTNVLLMFCIVVWCQLRLAYTGMKGQRRLTLMFFYVFVYVFLGVQPLLSVSRNEFPIEISLSEELITYTGLLVIIGIIAFEIGYMLRNRKIVATLPYKTQYRILSLRMLWYTTLAVYGLTILVILFYGPGIFVYGGGMFETKEIGQTESLLLVYGVRVTAAVVLFLGIYLQKISKNNAIPGYRGWSLNFALLLLSLLNFIVSMPGTTPRLWMGSLLLTSLFIAMRWRKVRSFIILTTISSLSLLILFSGIDPRHIVAMSARGESITPESISILIENGVQSMPTDSNFDAFTMLASTTQYTNKYGYSWGNQLLLPAFFWMPRSIWKSKPEGTPIIVASFLSLYSLNVSSPLWAEGYINFGICGLFAFLAFFGFFARVVDDFLVQTSDIPGSAFLTVTSSFFAANTFILLRGDLTSGTMYLQLVILASFLILLSNRFTLSPKVNSNDYLNQI